MSETVHPWCSDTARDEAIRAAEDAAAAERTPLPDHRDLPAAVAEPRRRVEGLEAVADHWRRQCEADAENREAAVVSREGVTFTENGVFREAKTPSGAVNHAADVSCGEADRLRKGPLEMPSKAWMKRMCEREGDSDCTTGRPVPPADGLRTERVTLEITQRAESYAPCRDLDWQRMLRQTPGGLFPGESVRVVEDRTGTDMGNGVTVASTEEVLAMCRETESRLTAERDAAIRERDAAKEECEGLRHLLKTKESECETHHPWVHPSAAPPAANAGVEAKPEPVAWGVNWGDHWGGEDSFSTAHVYRKREWAKTVASTEPEATLVPLFAAPQPPRGWLLDDERDAVDHAADIIEDMEDDDGSSLKRKADVLRCLLARFTPPRVKVPFVDPALARIVYGRDSEWLAALAAAGVEVKVDGVAVDARSEAGVEVE